MVNESAERALEQALLEGERIRLRVLAGSLIAVAFAMALNSIFAFEELAQLSGGRLPRWLPPTLLLWLAGVPLLVLMALRQYKGGRIPEWAHYLTAAAELSLPTIVGLVVARYLPPEVLMTSPLVLVYPLMITLYALRLVPGVPLFAGIWAGVQHLVLWAALKPQGDQLTFVFSAQVNLMKAFGLVLVGCATAFVAQQLRQRVSAVLDGQADRAAILQTFGRHVSPQVVDQLLLQKSHGESSLRYVCVMFLDIRGFTSMCEGRGPEEIVELLNAALGFMIDVVNDHDGIINKFLGDGFMAVFGAPLSDGRDALNGVECALHILERLAEEQAAGRVPATLRIGMGLHAGEVVTGNIGSSSREEYTVIGDVVNVAARIEGLNKRFGSTLLISGEVWRAVAELALEHESLGGIDVKGRVEPVAVYRLA